MTKPKTPQVRYEHAELCRRFTAWAILPVLNDKQISARNEAWNHYCDARDGLPTGTSAGRSMFGRVTDNQLRFFQ